jgi:molybdate transport system ATP-binding protein
MMPSFSLKINFDNLGTVSIDKGQCWLVHNYDPDLVNSFFDWLEGKKYKSYASIEFVSDTTATTDLFQARKHFKTLRFSLSDSDNSHFYYQQRYHSTENEDIQTLEDYLGIIADPYLNQLTIKLGLDKLYGEKINMLSTGEFRKAYMLKSSLSRPYVMFLDEPCTGLDADSCSLFNQLFAYLVKGGTSVVIFTATSRKTPVITNSLDIGRIKSEDYLHEMKDISVPEPLFPGTFESAFELRNIFARYNGRDVLHNVSWLVKRNERWSLTGHNGAGKSTLLSFVYADNPQVYSNTVFLFGRQRGTGESIWEVKDRIGFYSSELHRYFDKVQTVERAINSIVFQNPYEKRVLNDAEESFRHQLLTYFELETSGHKMLCDLPGVTQKLVILTAVLIKNAPLLILDEPFQGFSDHLIEKTMALLIKYVRDRTFIMVSHNHSDFAGSTGKHFHMEHGTGRETDLPPGLEIEVGDK